VARTPDNHGKSGGTGDAPGDRDTVQLLALVHDDAIRARIAAGHLRRLSEVYLSAVRTLLALEPTAPAGHVAGFFLDAYRQGQADAFASVRATLSAALSTGTPGSGCRPVKPGDNVEQANDRW
jgi:hypothetical protein